MRAERRLAHVLAKKTTEHVVLYCPHCNRTVGTMEKKEGDPDELPGGLCTTCWELTQEGTQEEEWF